MRSQRKLVNPNSNSAQKNNNPAQAYGVGQGHGHEQVQVQDGAAAVETNKEIKAKLKEAVAEKARLARTPCTPAVFVTRGDGFAGNPTLAWWK